ncbi:MAG: extracellular solute-binding protein [Candidatus Kapabacteria bacterium]|nr:extracellular solute-binding protein [Candidatus Kapabacteria bacterium]
MKTCQRIWMMPFLAMGMMIVMNGCGNGDTAEQGARTIRFWHFWSEPGQKAALQELVSEFERTNNVKVELTELSWNDGKVKLQAAFNSGAPPDVIELGSDWVAQFSSSGVLLALPGDAAALSRFVPYAIAPAMWQGRTYAYPWTLDTRVIYANDQLLSASGWKGPITTMDDLVAAAERVNASGHNGWGANGADAHRLYKKILPFMWTFGGDVLDEKGRPVLNSQENMKALTTYAQLARAGFVETQRQLDAAFIQGKIALWNSGSWLTKKINANTTLKATPMLMPGLNGAPGISFAGGEYLAVSASTKNSQKARDLVLFLTKGSTAVKFCTKVPEAGFPAEKGSYADSTLVADPIKAVFAKQLEHARMTPVHPRWLDLEAVLEDAVVRVLLGEATPEEALGTAQQEALQIVGG